MLLGANITREQAETAFAEFAEADAKQQSITAKMDVQITKIREAKADELTALTEKKNAAFEVMQVWAESNRDEFGKKKSIELTHGTIGFRIGMPKLNQIKGFNAESIAKLVKALLPTYIRTKAEVNKELLLADREKPVVKNKLAEVGLKVVQDETFFVEPKKEVLQEA